MTTNVHSKPSNFERNTITNSHPKIRKLFFLAKNGETAPFINFLLIRPQTLYFTKNNRIYSEPHDIYYKKL